MPSSTGTQWQVLPNERLRLNYFTASRDWIRHTTVSGEMKKATLDCVDDGKVDDGQSTFELELWRKRLQICSRNAEGNQSFS